MDSTVSDQLDGVILRYTRFGLGISLLANLLLGAAALIVRPAQPIPLSSLRALLLIAVLLLLGITRFVAARGYVLCLALLAVFVGCVHIAALDGDVSTVVVMTTVLGAAAAIAFPWGVWFQVAAVAIVELSTVAMLAWMTGSLGAAVLVYPGTAVSIVLAASIWAAHFSRRRWMAAIEREIVRARDVSQLQAKEAQTRQELSRLETLFRTAPIGLSLMDTQLRYLRVNDVLAELNGVPAAEHVGRTVFEILPSVAITAESLGQKVIATGEAIVGVELSGSTLREPGVTRYWRSDVWPLRDAQGAVAAMSWVVRDITEQKLAERALRQSEERLRIVTQATNDAVWDWDLVTDAVWWNTGLHTLFGYSAAAVGSTIGWWVDNIHPQDRERVISVVRAFIDSGGAYWVGEYRYRRADGSFAWVLDRGYVFHDEHGKPVRMVGAMVDISERKCAEEEIARLNTTLERRVHERTAQLAAANRQLEHEIGERQQAADAVRQSQQQLQDILDYTTAVVYLKDTAGRYLLINRQYEVTFHVRREELLGKTDYEVFPSAAADTYRDNDRQVLVANRSMTFEESAPQDDGLLHTYVSVKFPLFDASEAPYGICGISTDITARKRMEAELQASQAQLLTLIENTSDAIWSVDGDYRLTAFNSIAAQGFYHIYRTPLRLGERIDLNIPEAEVAYWRLHYGRVFAGESLRFEHEYTINGERRSFLISMTPIMAAARATGATAFGKDITDLKRAQEQVRTHQEELAHVLRVHSMGEMAAALAHEINQPLGAIANYAQGCSRRIAAGAATVDELLPAIEEITTQALRAGEITRRVRQLMQKQTPPHEEVDLNGVVADAVQVVAAKAHQLGIALRVELAPDLPPIEIDRIQIEQVIVNLILNGLEAMQTKQMAPRELSVQTARSENGTLDVAVRDGGIGLTPSIMEKMFDPFSTSKPSGLGMGLAISQSIVQRHGGRIWAGNNTDGGATFHMTLPMTHQPPAVRLGAEEGAEAS